MGACCSRRNSEEETVIRDCLRAHNQYRAKHGVPPLKLNRQLCRMAKEWSNELTKRATPHSYVLEHSDNQRRFKGGAVGENIHYKQYISSDPRLVREKRCDGEEATKSWYDELFKPGYKYSRPGFQPGTGHFTQIVWKETRLVGIAMTKRMTEGEVKFFVVANYYPAGNVNTTEYFRDNVLPAKN